MALINEAKRDALCVAFEDFNALSRSLNESYDALEESVVQLTRELNAERQEKEKQKALRHELLARHSALVSEIPAGVVVLDAKSQVVEANPFAQMVMDGLCPGQHWPSLLQRLDAQWLTDELLVLGSGRELRCQVQPFKNETTVLVSDVTALNRWQASRHREERLDTLGSMVAGMAHQLRTPLTSALLTLDRIGPTTSGADCVVQRDRVAARLQQIEELVEQMLAFVRDGSRCFRLYSVDDFIAQIVATLEPLIEASAGRLNVVRQGASGAAHGDPEALVAAVLTLAENAIQRIPGVELSLTFEVSSDQVAVSVRDNGYGIAPEHLSRIFDPFFSTSARGTGLGLAVVDAVAREHGGDVEARNVEDGACFCLRIERFAEEMPVTGE